MKVNIYFLLLFLIFNTSCNRKNKHDITIKNMSSEEILDAHVLYNDFMSVGGCFSPGGEGTHMSVYLEIPEDVYVIWKTKRGKSYKVKLNVKDKLPNNFEGIITYKIEDKGKVSIDYITYEEWEKNLRINLKKKGLEKLLD